jgi:hypothetical protein
LRAEGNDVPLQTGPAPAAESSDRGEYAGQFRLHCHQLIVFGYRRIRAEDHRESHEDVITQRLKEGICAAQDERVLPGWADRYYVTDQVPVSVPGRLGKDRPKIDLEMQSAEARPCAIYHFEAKRLRRDDTHSVSEYLGKDGLRMFLTEQYGRCGDEGGMLGYVQSDSPADWAGKVGRRLHPDRLGNCCLTADGAWAEVRLTADLEYSFITARSTDPRQNRGLPHVFGLSARWGRGETTDFSL